jgi:hypothetical protein
MKLSTKIYLKLFLGYGIMLGVFMSFWEYIADGEFNIMKVIFMVIFFGGFMSWISVKSMKKLKSGNTELTEEDFNVSQSEIIAKNKSIKEIFDLLKSEELTKNWRLKIEESKIAGRTKVSWTSWGERIIISDVHDKIRIESKPILGTVLFDNRTNKENVSLLKVLIENETPGHKV